MSQAEYIRDLRDVIQKVHGVRSLHVKSVPITEILDGKVVWDGVVEVFQLRDHPISDRLYAWSHKIDESGERRYVNVFHVKPITSPLQAVRAAIVEEHKSREEKRSKSG